jgi:hypothetical protein
MRPDEIRRWLRRQPFRPFRLHVLETTFYEIRHPEQALIAQSTITIDLPNAGDPMALGEHYVTIALLHVSKLEAVLTPANPLTNGG